MPQGKMKTKVKLPKGVKQKQKAQKKDVLRKGHMTIAPKKARLVEASKFKKGLENKLKSSIEEHAVSRAAYSEPRSLLLLKSSAPATESKSAAKSNKQK